MSACIAWPPQPRLPEQQVSLLSPTTNLSISYFLSVVVPSCFPLLKSVISSPIFFIFSSTKPTSSTLLDYAICIHSWLLLLSLSQGGLGLQFWWVLFVLLQIICNRTQNLVGDQVLVALVALHLLLMLVQHFHITLPCFPITPLYWVCVIFFP